MKILENATMIHVALSIPQDDYSEVDIAVEDCENYFDDAVYEEWKKEVYEAVQKRYNPYGYWTEVKITEEIWQKNDDGVWELHIYDL